MMPENNNDMEIKLQDNLLLDDLASKVGEAIKSSKFSDVLTEFALSEIEVSIKFNRASQESTQNLQFNKCKTEVRLLVCYYYDDDGNIHYC